MKFQNNILSFRPCNFKASFRKTIFRFSLSVSHSGDELLLASCSQDSLIRVWRLCAKSGTDTHTANDHTVIKMKEDVFEVKDRGERASHA